MESSPSSIQTYQRPSCNNIIPTESTFQTAICPPCVKQEGTINATNKVRRESCFTNSSYMSDNSMTSSSIYSNQTPCVLSDRSQPSTERFLSLDQGLLIENNLNTVRHVWSETWNDFHVWKTPSTLPMENGWVEQNAEKMDQMNVQKHQDFGNRMRDMLEAYSKRAGGGQKCLNTHTSKLEGATVLKSIATKNNKPIYWRLNGSKPDFAHQTFELSASVHQVPRYTFCIRIQRSILSPDVVILPFMPTFNDDDRDIFDAEAYVFKFQGTQWTAPGRDADVDIVMFEARQRLKKLGMNKEDIDNTRVLPKDCYYIDNLTLERDLPPFPRPSQYNLRSNSTSMHSGRSSSEVSYGIRPSKEPEDLDRFTTRRKRKLNSSLRFQKEVYSDKVDTFKGAYCHNRSCTSFMCVRHSAVFYDGLTRNQSRKVVSRNNKKLPILTNIIDSIDDPCSVECYSLFSTTFSTLEIEAASKGVQKRRWSDDEKQQLLDILQVWDTEHAVRLCHLKDVFGVSCIDVVLEIIMLAESDSQFDIAERNIGQSSNAYEFPSTAKPQVNKVKPKSKNKNIKSHAILNTLPEFQECKHAGECVSGICSCADTGWPCGRDCSCPVYCYRRFRGCNCYRTAIEWSKTVHRNQVCIKGRCPCISNGVECDPRLCRGCGAETELLDQELKEAKGKFLSDGKWLLLRDTTYDHVTCGNVAMQKRQWPKLRVGISPIAGYGLFADENIDKGVFIGEYVGEYISVWEGNNRSSVEAISGRCYQFAANADSVIDAAFYGNEIRYINSGTGRDANCVACPRAVHHEHRILFLTTRPIKKHEELRFDYGEDYWKNHLISGSVSLLQTS
ncbi:uncharacterized protein L203_106256 [Cryptococcus depauperatus CBS 7841]|uniref:Uncharacterized protein n=1 Tax=Cryptococcus depauperatus CBS 7841 TaxID=1295531 RepID=A0AAJ8JZ00_9TREE